MGFWWFFLGAIAELWVMAAVAKRIGVLAVVALLVLFMLVGLQIARAQGVGMLRSLRARRPGENGALATEGGLIMLAALLLIVPGFLSTLAGLLLLIPAVRQLVARHWPKRAGRVWRTHVFFGPGDSPHARPDPREPFEDEPRGVIEVEAKIVEPDGKDKKDGQT